MTHPTTSTSPQQDLERHSCSRDRSENSSASLIHGEFPHDTVSLDAPPPLGAIDDAESDLDMDEPAPASQPAHNRRHTRGGRGRGDVVLILGLPDVFTVGYDTVSFTAKHVRGIRDVPAGPHFFWAAHPGGMAPRSGFWIVSDGAGRVHAVRWDRESELLVDAPPDAVPRNVVDDDAFHASLLSYRDPTARVDVAGAAAGGSVGDMDETRAADGALLWSQLTSAVTAELLSRVTGQSGGVAWHIDTMDRVRGEELPSSAERAMEQQIAHAGDRRRRPPPPERELRFALDQHARTYSAARFGEDRTREATDATSYLVALLDGGAVTEADLVGELQLAFLAGALLGSDACLAQWWHVVLRLLLRAYALPRRRPGLAAAWLRAVAAQLAYGGAWLDTTLAELSEARGRELRLALIVYRRRLEEEEEEEGEEGLVAEAAAAFARLEAVVAGDGYGWDLRGEYLRSGRVVMEDGEEVELEMQELQAEDERGEWAPEVVELDEHGREKGLISWND